MKNKKSKLDFIYQGRFCGVSTGTWVVIGMIILAIFLIPMFTR